MGRLVRLCHGVWEKNVNGEWHFLVVDQGPTLSVLVGENETYEGLVKIVKRRFYVGAETMLALTYQYPAWMLGLMGKRTPPVDFNEDGDVELFMAVHVDNSDMEICVTIGTYHVERYLFQRGGTYDVGGSSNAVIGPVVELGNQPITPSPANEMIGAITSVVGGETNVYPRTGSVVCRGGNQPPTCGGVDDAMSFWDGLVGGGVVVASEHVLKEICTDEELEVMYLCHKAITAGPPVPALVISDGDNSSSGSSDDVRHLCTTDKGKGIMNDTIAPSRPPPDAVFRRPAPNGMPSAPVVDLSAESSGEEDDLVCGPGDLYVGMQFKDRDAFKLHMALFAITHKFRYHNKKSTPNVMILECKGIDCPWRVYATKMIGSDLYQIRRVRPEHRCSVDERVQYDRHATTAVIGDVVRNRYNGIGVGPNPNDVREMMRDSHDIPISYWKAWRSREVALDTARGDSGSSYHKLPVYLHQLVASNPGTVVALETSPSDGVSQKFRYLFFAMGASVAGLAYMRKVIVIDGTHLKGKYRGCLITASCQDGNYQIFPVAFGVVDGENDSSWTWFFSKLRTIIDDSEDLVFISDRHSSIYSGMRKMYPWSKHCACILHLQRNIQTIFKKRQLGYLVSRAARAYHLRDFYSHFNQIKVVSHACADYLLGIGFEHWARAHFEGARYNIMTSNIAESLNAALGDARGFPIVPLIEYIRCTLMGWFNHRRDKANSESGTLTPKIQEMLSKRFQDCGGFSVVRINESEFEVRTKEGVPYHVDLAEKSCSCCEFDMLRIPCTHAVAAAVRSKMRVDSLVDNGYTTAFWRLAYGQSIYPVEDLTEADQVAEEIKDLHLGPPATRRPPGRPRKQRFLSRGEYRGTARRRLTICGRCGGLGHNRASCRMPI